MTPAQIVISVLSAQSGVDGIKPTDTIAGLGLDSAVLTMLTPCRISRKEG